MRGRGTRGSPPFAKTERKGGPPTQTVKYIQEQAEHHKKHSFEEEFIAFLEKNKIDYDPRYVWG